MPKPNTFFHSCESNLFSVAVVFLSCWTWPKINKSFIINANKRCNSKMDCISRQSKFSLPFPHYILSVALSLSRYPLPLAPRRFPLTILHISACIVCLAARILTRDELLWLISHKKRNRNRFWSCWNQRARCSCLCLCLYVCCSSWRVIDGFPLNAFIYREDKLWRWKWHIERVAHVYISRSSSLSVSLCLLLRQFTFGFFKRLSYLETMRYAMTWWWRWQCWPNNKHSPKIYNNNKNLESRKKTQKSTPKRGTEQYNTMNAMDCIENKWFYRISFGESSVP